MNPYSNNNDSYYQEEEEEEEEAYIDPNDLIMIDHPETWEPTQEQIEIYANQIGIDQINSPPEALEIAYKYLTQKIPSDWKRAFTKENPQVLYIDMKTNEIHLTTDIEENAKLEYQELMNQYREKKKQEDEEGKKVKVIPRTKIPPIGGSKVEKNPQKEREKKFIEGEIKKDNLMRKNKMEENDEDTKNLKNKIEKEELKKKKQNFFDYDDNDNEFEYFNNKNNNNNNNNKNDNNNNKNDDEKNKNKINNNIK